MRLRSVIRATSMVAAGLFLTACHAAPKSTFERDNLHTQVEGTIVAFKNHDPSMQQLFDTAYGYAVFPTVTKGAVGIGGAHGRGEVYEQQQMVGYCDVTQGTIGLQLGGQSFSQVIYFEDEWALSTFKAGDLALAAQASAVAAASGAAAAADYERGVLVFAMTKGGLMFEASIGGQNFRFVPRAESAAHEAAQ